MAYYLGKELAPGADINSLLSGAYNLSGNKTQALNTQTTGTLPSTPLAQPQTTTAATAIPTTGCRNTPAPGLCNANEVESKTLTGYRCCPKPGACDDVTNPCPEGQRCFEGKCKPIIKRKCSDTIKCPDGYQCINGVCEKIITCSATIKCPTGYVCTNGQCIKINENCPEGTGEAMSGCACGKWYTTMTGKCTGDYVFIDRSKAGTNWDGYKPGAKGRCECPKYLNQDNGDNTSEYKWPPEMQELMDLLLGRATDLLGKDTGYSQEAQDKMFGQNFDKVRTAETGSRESLEEQLARSGMLGTGTGIGALSDLSQSTENNITDIARQLFVGNEDKKKQDLLDYTNLANTLTTSGVSFEQIQEAINAARRGESMNWYAMLMALYQAMLGSAS